MTKLDQIMRAPAKLLMYTFTGIIVTSALALFIGPSDNEEDSEGDQVATKDKDQQNGPKTDRQTQTQ